MRKLLKRGAILPVLFLLLSVSGCFSGEKRPEHNTEPLLKDAEVSSDEPGKYGGIFTTSISRTPQTLNPLVAEDIYSRIIIGNLFYPLVRLDPMRNEVIPGLAKSWSLTPDKLTYTFKLREGHKWSDGAPLTADDVIFTFNAIFDRRYPNRFKSKFEIGGKPLLVRKIDATTVEIKSAVPYSPLLIDLIELQILPKHKLEKAFYSGALLKVLSLDNARKDPSIVASSGPFIIHNYTPGEQFGLEPNPHFYRVDKAGQRLPYVDYFVYKIVPDVNTEMILFATGQTDLTSTTATGPDLPWLNKASQKYDFTLYNRGPSTSMRYLWFNLNHGKDSQMWGRPFVSPQKQEYFGDKRFRQAISYGIDRKGVINAVFAGKGRPQKSVISEANTKWFEPHVREYPYSPEKSRELFHELGFKYSEDGKLLDKQGKPIRFELIAREHHEVAPTFHENMKALGIDVRITYLDFNALMTRITQTFQYEAATVKFVSDTDDPSSSKVIFKSSGHLHFWEPNQQQPRQDWEHRVDEIMDLQEQTFDMEKRIRLIREMQMILMEELPLIPLVNHDAYLGVSNRWHNVKIPSIGIAIWNPEELWTDQKKSHD